ncbi:MAG: hypothetical protein UZ01_02524 [Candidatus Brocadia sinica]|nr:MAG: hypothetical protein UZ01_02524 [Candidatus Brocadia sinica]
MNKQQILSKLNIRNFYQSLIPSLKINDKPEVLGLCPFHDDESPSLSVNLKKGLYHCFACGVSGDAIDFYQRLNNVDFKTALDRLGEMTNVTERPKVVARYEYKDGLGNVLYAKERIEPGRNERRKEFVFKHLDGVTGRGCDPVLYHLPDVLQSKYVFVVEGEAKADLLNSWGLVATCLDSGANSPWRDEYNKAFEGKEKVVILPDNDKPGRLYANRIASALHGKVGELRVVELPGLQEKGDVIDWVKVQGNDKTKLMELVQVAQIWTPTLVSATSKVDVVGEVDEVEAMTSIPVFPIDVFPDEFKKFVDRVSTSISINREITASIALGVLSACIGSTVRVSPKYGYTVAPFLWVAAVLASGTGKTPLTNTLTNPIKKFQAESWQRYKRDLEQYENELCAFRRNKGDVGEIPRPPKLGQFYISDSTVEALADVFENQPRGVLNYQDELSGLILGLNQYKAKGNDLQHYLELFNCGSWKIDRKGGSVFIPNVGMGIIGGIQPAVLTQVLGDGSFNDGFIYRFIFVCPEIQPAKFSREGIGGEDLVYWEDLIRWGYDIPLALDGYGFVKPKMLALSDEALNLWEKFYNEYGELMTVLPAKTSGFIPKLYSYSLKLAGLLHIIEGFGVKHISPVISENTIRNAIKLTEYYFGQANKVLGLYGKKKEVKEYHKRIMNVIHTLQGDVANGKLKLSKIVEGYNEGLPPHAHLTSKKMSNVLNDELGLTAKESTGGCSYLFWESTKIENLFKANVTNVTNVTQKPVEEVGEVTFGFESKNEISIGNVENLDIEDLSLMEVTI